MEKRTTMERTTPTTPALPGNPPIQQSITPFPTTLPAAGTSAVRKYNPECFRGYRLNAKQVGLWSDIASVSVMW
jgi:hypothetical protein